MKKAILYLNIVMGLFITQGVMAQTTFDNVPPLSGGGNSAGGISFNFTTNQAIIVENLRSSFSSASGTATIWYNPQKINGAPTVSTANGWVNLGTSASFVGISPSVTEPIAQTIPIPLNLLMLAQDTVGFFIEWTGNVFSTKNTNTPTFTDGVVTLIADASCAFTGTGTTPTYNPRQINGGVIYSLTTPPVCGVAKNGAFSNSQITSVDFSWTHGAGNDDYELEYGVAGFAMGSGTTITGAVAGTSGTETLTGLVAGSTYHVYITETCNGGADEYTVGPLDFINDYCGVSTTNSGDRLSVVSSSGAEENVSYTASSQPAGSYANETAQTFESYETQAFDINTTYVGGANGVNVWVDWNNDLTFSPSELMASETSTAASKTLEITVPVGTQPGNYRMRVRGQYGSSANPPACGNATYGTTVDFTLTIVTPPNCLTPIPLYATNITSTSADLNWTENSGATTWNIEYGVAGFTQGNGTIVNGVTAMPHAITLSPETDYEFYVQSDCSGGDLSPWAGPSSFSNAYCEFTTTSSSPQHISSFITTGAIVDINNPASGPGTTSVGYSDFSTIVMEAYENQTIEFAIAASNTSTYGVSIYVDWNDDFIFDASEKVYGTGSYISMPMTGSFVIPVGASIGQHRMRVVADYTGSNPSACNGSSAEAEDYTLEIVTPPTCLPPMDLNSLTIASSTIELEWTETNILPSTSWNIEYGPTGFSQGSGTVILANTNPFTVTGLSASTGYSFYVQSDCGGGDESSWRGPYSTFTACGTVVAPFYEGFNNAVQPQCWENLSSDPGTGVDNFWRFNKQGEHGALNNGKAIGTFVSSDGSAPNPDSMMLITPPIDISQLTTPYLSFEWFSNNTNFPGDNTPLIVELYDGTAWHLLDTLKGDDPEWLFESYNLSAYANNTIKIRFMTNQKLITTSAWFNDILLDEVRIDNCLSGQDGSRDVCRLDGTLNLNDNIVLGAHGGGKWSAGILDSHITNDSIFNFSVLPSGSYEVYYIEKVVCIDTSIATINVFNLSSAGTGTSITVCRNEPTDLFSALLGNVDMDGDWYSSNGDLLPNSQPIAPNLSAQYNYNYITTNGVCPADTAIVEVNVGTCDYLTIVEEMFTEISVYPNPATSKLNIVNPSNTSSLKVELLDMNGRVVLVENKALKNASEATIAIDHLERGIYTLRVYNDEGQRTFKVVKQ